MPRPQIPTPLAELGNRPFSFYPPVWNAQHNEWIMRRADWDEIHVVNTKSLLELSIPRRFVNGVSSIEEPVVIVGLRKELELREGVIVPRVQRVIEMPRAVNDIPRWSSPEPEPGRLAPVIGIRVENTAESPRSRKLFATIAAGVLASVVGLVILRDTPLSGRGRYLAVPAAGRVPLPFTAADDYLTVVNKIGHPTQSRTFVSANGAEFQILLYPERQILVVLQGPERDQAHYIGAVGRGGRVVHSVRLADGQDSFYLLSHLK